jgi:hypothetical protein
LKPKIVTATAGKRKILFLAAIGLGSLVVWFFFAKDWVNYANWSFDLDLIPTLASAYLDKLFTGSDAHGNLVFIRMFFTIIIVSLALIGSKLAYDRGNARMMFIIIFAGIVPIFLFYYGVEIVQRAFLFCGLPLAVLISLGLDKKKFLTIVLIFLFIAVPFHTLTMYGNEKIDYTPASQVDGAQFLFDNVPNGIIHSGNPVDRSQFVENYTRIAYGEVDFFTNPDYDLYLIYCSSNEYFSIWYHGDNAYIDSFNDRITSDEYLKIFDSPDCQIYKFIGY